MFQIPEKTSEFKLVRLLEGRVQMTKGYILLILPVFLFVVSFALGRYPVAPEQLMTILTAKLVPLRHTWPDTLETVIFQVRLPRIIAAMLVGTSLAVAGAAYQGMFKNPLVSPDILGASAGAGFGAALAIFYSFSVVGIQALSFSCGLLAVLSAYFISSRIRHDPMLALVLSGILIGTLFTAGISLLKYMADPYDKLPAITFWLMGSLAAVTPRDVFSIIIPMLVGIVPLYLLRWRLNVLSLGEEEARALGVDTGKLKILIIICSTLMTAAAVSVCGVIGWVGLLVPHLARMVVGPNYKVLLPASILIGSSYLLLVDDLARILASVEIPLGILTSLIGAPFFLYLLQHSRRGWS